MQPPEPVAASERGKLLECNCTTLQTIVPSCSRQADVMQFSRFSTVNPSLSTDDVRADLREILAAFPTPALPGFLSLDWRSSFIGTIQPSDSLTVFCLPCLFNLSGILDRS